VKTSLSIIVPVYNEEYLVDSSLARLAILGESPLLERIRVIVVDDCSTDRTSETLARFRASLSPDWGSGKFAWTWLRHDHNRGKGAAIRTGLAHADTDLTVIHDADLEYHPGDLLKMIPLFLEEDADAVYGSRFLSGDYHRVLFFRHQMGNNLITFLCSLVSDLNLSDIETCYKMIRTRLFQSIPLVSGDFRFEVEITIKLAKRGARVFEVPIRYSGRTYQEGKKIGWKDGLRALLAILWFAISDKIFVEDEHGSQILARLSRAPRFHRWTADRVRPYLGERVLEIGAGIGILTANLVPRALYWATDTNPLYLDDLRHLSRTRPYLRVGFTDSMNRQSFPADGHFDTVICLNVLEHVVDDAAALSNVRAVLPAGGRAIVLVPQHPHLYSTLDRALGHHRRYTKKQLIALGERAGLRVVTLKEYNRPGVVAWWLNGKVLRRKTFGLLQVKLLNLLVPVFRRIDAWLPLPALSLIAVFEPTEASKNQAVRRS
jgi:glycosyltransferase involved in cell wall biosynthesis